MSPSRRMWSSRNCLRGVDLQDEVWRGPIPILLRVEGVDTRAIRDVSFVDGSVCSLLTEEAYKGNLVKTLTFEGSPLKVLENFDTMSKMHFKESMLPSRIISPVDVFIKRAVSAVANNRRLKVATKYQCQLPVEHREKLRLEVQKILDTRRGRKKASKEGLPAPAPVVVGDSTPETGGWILTHEQRRL